MFGRQKFIVMEHERGLLFHQGKLVETLDPGKHVRRGKDYEVLKYDIRWTQVTLGNQEITCADGVTVRASAKLLYRVADVEKAYRSTSHMHNIVYEAVHEALREVLGALSVEDALAKRSEHSARLTEFVKEQAMAVGVETGSCTLRDIGVSGEIKRAFGQLIVAQKEAQATLERARGETAALRSLANAAKLMDSNPNLLQLRWIHALDQTKGATIVLSPSGMIPPPSSQTTEQ